MKEKVGAVFSVAKENQPVPGCTISKEIHGGDNPILYFSLAKNTDISAEIYPYHKLLIVADGSMEVYGVEGYQKRLELPCGKDRRQHGDRKWQEADFREDADAHWPDSMATFMTGDNILFSNDVFGQHYAVEELFNDKADPCLLNKEAMKYFDNILNPFAPILTKKLAEAGFEVIEENIRSQWNPEESDFAGIPALVTALNYH